MSGTIYRPEEEHPQPWQEDLNPEAGAGLNHGIAGEAQEQKALMRTMHELKDVHRRFRDWNDVELKQVPILHVGARLEADARYLNLRDRVPTERHASGEEIAGPEDYYVPKSQTPYELWNRLLGHNE